MTRCCCIFKGALTGIFICVFGSLLAVAWPHAAAVSIEPAVIALAAAGIVYTGAGAFDWVFEPPTAQRGALHGVCLVSFWWAAGMCHVVARARRWAPETRGVPDAEAAHWQPLVLLGWTSAGLVTLYALLRMCTEDCIARVRHKKALRRRERKRAAAAANPRHTEMRGPIRA